MTAVVVDLARERAIAKLTGRTRAERRAIEGEFALAVYRARRRADLQLAGEIPVPEPSREALELLDRLEPSMPGALRR